LASAFVLLLLADEPWKTNKLALRVEKVSSFKTERRIKIRRHGFVEKLSGNILAKFQPTVDLELKTYVQLAKILLSKKKTNLKYIFCGVLLVMRL